MNTDDKKLSDIEIEEMRQRRIDAMHLQDIEDNPLDDEDIAIFEMFEREGWTVEQRREFLLQSARDLAEKLKK